MDCWEQYGFKDTCNVIGNDNFFHIPVVIKCHFLAFYDMQYMIWCDIKYGNIGIVRTKLLSIIHPWVQTHLWIFVTSFGTKRDIVGHGKLFCFHLSHIEPQYWTQILNQIKNQQFFISKYFWPRFFLTKHYLELTFLNKIIWN